MLNKESFKDKPNLRDCVPAEKSYNQELRANQSNRINWIQFGLKRAQEIFRNFSYLLGRMMIKSTELFGKKQKVSFRRVIFIVHQQKNQIPKPFEEKLSKNVSKKIHSNKQKCSGGIFEIAEE